MARLNEQYLSANRAAREADARFYDAREAPFEIYGLYRPREAGAFKRLPDDIARGANERVAQLSTNTAGGRARFSTDSRYIAVKTAFPCLAQRPILTLLASAGFDIYVEDRHGREEFAGSLLPPIDAQTGYEAVFTFPDRRRRAVTLYFPLYNDLSRLEIGLQADAWLGAGAPYAHETPVVYYGSSITQGSAASRPGLSYAAMISRALCRDYLNLGFSGAALGEEGLLRYIASLDMAAFVLDYDHNAPTVAHLQSTHAPAYRLVHAAHPDIPILLASRPDADCRNPETALRRCAVFSTYREALESGDRNVYFIDGRALLGADNAPDCTVDGTHPNDIGMLRMAETIGGQLKAAL